MKHSRSINLCLLTMVTSVMACAPDAKEYDPCKNRTFNSGECQRAIAGGGYYYQGVFVPMRYSQPYSYYYSGYQSHLLSGGRLAPASRGSYAKNYIAPSYRSGATTSRGGFGSVGSGRTSFGG